MRISVCMYKRNFLLLLKVFLNDYFIIKMESKISIGKKLKIKSKGKQVTKEKLKHNIQLINNQ